MNLLINLTVTGVLAASLIGCGGGGSSGGSKQDVNEPEAPVDQDQNLDIIDRASSFNAQIDNTYNARGFSLGVSGTQSSSEQIIQRGETLDPTEVVEKRANADEIGSDHYCRIDTTNVTTYCQHLDDDNIASASTFTGDGFDSLRIHIANANGSLTEMQSLSTGEDWLSGGTIYAMTPSPTGSIDEFSSTPSIVGDWSIRVATVSPIDLSMNTEQGSMTCTSTACSGDLEITNLLYDSENIAWAGKTIDPSGVERILIGTVSRDNQVLSFYFSDNTKWTVIGAEKVSPTSGNSVIE